jgi:hypothetical protein
MGKPAVASSIAPDIAALLTDSPDILFPSVAERFLRQLLSGIDLLALFQHYFPEHFRVAEEEHLPLFPETNTSYSQFEQRFFRLVHEHLFPLPFYLDWGYYDDPWGERGYAECIPVEPFGFELEVDCGYEELDFGWQLLLCMLGMLDEEVIRNNGVYEDDDLYAISLPEAGKSMDWNLLHLRCQAQGGPIMYLPLAASMLENDTGSIWLDATAESPCTDAFWSISDVDELHHQYLLALDIQEKAGSFIKWLEERPVAHFAAIVRLWKSCIRDTPQRRPGEVRMRTITNEAFAAGINFNELFERHIALPAHRQGREEGEEQ